MGRLLGVEFDQVERELTVSGSATSRADRLDLLLLRAGSRVAAIEVKLLSDLGPQQLTRYLESFAGARTYAVLHLERLPVTLRHARPWRALTWEAVLDAYAASTNSWVATTAQAWRSQLTTLVPAVDATVVWNDVPDDAPGMELALRTRVAWLSRQMDAWCRIEHDIEPSSGGGTWAVRMWAPPATYGHVVVAEIQEGMTAYEWKRDPDRPYRQRLKGPVVLLGVRQDGITTSGDFDWALLHRLFAKHVPDEHGAPRRDFVWQLTSARPNDPTDKANWSAAVAAGAPPWLGKGWGMKVAQSTGSCHFGARLTVSPDATLGEIDAELRRLQPVVEQMAASARAGSHLAAISPLDTSRPTSPSRH